MKINLFSIFLLIGITLGACFPYLGLELGKYSFFTIFLLMLANLFGIHFKIKDIAPTGFRDFYVLFISFIFYPSLLFLITHFLPIGQMLRYGLFVNALAPIAIVAPSFLQTPSQKTSTIRLVILSTLLLPFFLPIMSKLFFSKIISIHILTIFKDTFVLTALPLLIVFIFNHFFMNFKLYVSSKISKQLHIVNMALIGFLTFNFVGASFAKNSFQLISTFEVALTLALAIFQDFGMFYLSRLLKLSIEDCVALSIKNVALTGTIATIFFPQAVFPTSLILVSHFFIFLLLPKMMGRNT